MALKTILSLSREGSIEMIRIAHQKASIYPILLWKYPVCRILSRHFTLVFDAPKRNISTNLNNRVASVFHWNMDILLPKQVMLNVGYANSNYIVRLLAGLLPSTAT